VLSIGLTFSLGVAISYFFYGIFVAHIFKYIASIRIIVGIAAILLAVPRMVYTLKGEELKLTPAPLRPIVGGYLRKGNVWYALVGGLLAGFILMPAVVVLTT